MLLLVAIAWTPPAAAGVTVRVPDDAASLDEALALVGDGDTIALGPGSFSASQPLSVPVTGDGPSTVLLGPVVADGLAVVLRALTVDGGGVRPLSCTAGSLTLLDVDVIGGGDAGDGQGGGQLWASDCDVHLHGVSLAAVDLAPAYGNGGLVAGSSVRLTAVDAELSGGSAVDGGAVHLTGGALYGSGLSLQSNTAVDDGGGLWLDGVTLGVVRSLWSDNVGGDRGGVVDARGGAAVLVDVALRDNLAGGGAGGAYVDGELWAERLTVSGNASGNAGGLACVGGPCTVTDSTFEANVGSSGGGLQLFADGARWARSTFCGNQATGGFFAGYGGGVVANGDGGLGEGNLYVGNTSGFVGGGASLDGDLTVAHDVYVANSAYTQGAGAYVVFGYGTVSNSVFVGHPGPAAALGDLFAGVTTSTNLFYDNDGGASEQALDASDLDGVDPLLPAAGKAVCDRSAYAPSAGSPLIDGGSGPDDLDGSPADIGLQGGPSWDPTDLDGDGLAVPVDCDDGDGVVGGQQLLFADTDGDGFGSYGAVGVGCPDPTGKPATVAVSGDCDDGTADVHPDAVDLTDGLDNDCNGIIDDGAAQWFRDADGDGYGDASDVVEQLEAPQGYVEVAGDCDDDDPAVNPDASEVCGGGDEDCDGLVDDDNPSVSGLLSWYPDGDGDGYGDEAAPPVQACAVPGAVSDATDCDDSVVAVNPGAAEVCDPDDTDEDCDGLVDDDDPDVSGTTEWAVDEDGDGFGGVAGASCEPPPEAVSDTSDCDDTRPGTFPGADEVPDDGIDQDCDGVDAVWLYGRGGCGCSPAAPPRGLVLLPILAMILGRRRERRRSCRT